MGDAENTDGNAERPPHLWKPGQSGNPKGKPHGCCHRATQLADSLIGDEAERLVRKVVERALAGDSVCLRLCLERLSVPRKERPVEFELPPMTGAGATVAAVAAVAEAVAAGQITPSEAVALAAVVESYRKAVETQDLERRVAALESYQGGKAWLKLSPHNALSAAGSSGNRAARRTACRLAP